MEMVSKDQTWILQEFFDGPNKNFLKDFFCGFFKGIFLRTKYEYLKEFVPGTMRPPNVHLHVKFSKDRKTTWIIYMKFYRDKIEYLRTNFPKNISSTNADFWSEIFQGPSNLQI